jgi:hypothetical protein
MEMAVRETTQMEREIARERAEMDEKDLKNQLDAAHQRLAQLREKANERRERLIGLDGEGHLDVDVDAAVVGFKVRLRAQLVGELRTLDAQIDRQEGNLEELAARTAPRVKSAAKT